MPSLLIPPPYLFTGGDVGLMQVGALIGFNLAMFFGGYISDVITARQIIKNNGIVITEERLKSLIPLFWVAPVGCLLTGLAGEKLWPWYSIAISFGMRESFRACIGVVSEERALRYHESAVSFGTVFAPNIAVTYVIDSFPKQAAQCLVSINVFKNMVAFLFLYQAAAWIQAKGFLQPYVIMMALQLAIFIFAVPLYFYGHRLRHSQLLNRLNEALQ